MKRDKHGVPVPRDFYPEIPPGMALGISNLRKLCPHVFGNAPQFVDPHGMLVKPSTGKSRKRRRRGA